MKPAVYHEPEHESEQKVTPFKVLQVQQDQPHVEKRSSESGVSDVCERKFWFGLLLVFVILLSLVCLIYLKFGL